MGGLLAIQINEGRMPADRLVLRELAKEMTAWPNLEVWIDSFFLLPKHSSLCGPKIFVMLNVLLFIQSTKFEHWIVLSVLQGWASRVEPCSQPICKSDSNWCRPKIGSPASSHRLGCSSRDSTRGRAKGTHWHGATCCGKKNCLSTHSPILNPFPLRLLSFFQHESGLGWIASLANWFWVYVNPTK